MEYVVRVDCSDYRGNHGKSVLCVCVCVCVCVLARAGADHICTVVN